MSIGTLQFDDERKREPNCVRRSTEHLLPENAREKSNILAKLFYVLSDETNLLKILNEFKDYFANSTQSVPANTDPVVICLVEATGTLSGKNDKKEYVFVIIDVLTKFTILCTSYFAN